MCQVKLCPCMVLFFNEVEDYIKYLAISRYFVGFLLLGMTYFLAAVYLVKLQKMICGFKY